MEVYLIYKEAKLLDFNALVCIYNIVHLLNDCTVGKYKSVKMKVTVTKYMLYLCKTSWIYCGN